MPPAFFALIIFYIRCGIYTQPDLECHLPIYASHIAEMTGMYHHTQLLLVEMGSCELLAHLASNQDSLDSYLPGS
jgi:hypothetical protein